MQLITDKKGHNYYIPVYFMILLTAAFWFFIVMIENLRKGKNVQALATARGVENSALTENESEKQSLLPQPIKSRVDSIDVFRGIAICIMIFANYGAGQYRHSLMHATWDGITLADFAFPL